MAASRLDQLGVRTLLSFRGLRRAQGLCYLGGLIICIPAILDALSGQIQIAALLWSAAGMLVLVLADIGRRRAMDEHVKEAYQVGHLVGLQESAQDVDTAVRRIIAGRSAPAGVHPTRDPRDDRAS